MTDLTERQREYLEALPAPSYAAWGEQIGVAGTTVEGARDRLNDHDGIQIEKVDGEWRNVADRDLEDDVDEDEADPEPDPDERLDLTKRESYIYRTLPASEEQLASDLDVSPRVIEAHLDSIEAKGWSLEGDDAGNWIGPDQDHLRSSEHKQTRTRKANRWWQKRHDELVHEFQQLEWPRTNVHALPDHEDWVTHLTDLHAGDRVRRDDGRVVYSTDGIPAIIDYVTERSLKLSRKHDSLYDTAHLLWGGDFITNEGIYEGQHEDLDAWLDEQHDVLVDPLIRQVKAFSKQFPNVQVVCQVGNHGDHRASGTSRQANADLILYKHIRNTVAQIRKHADGLLENVEFIIGEAKAFRNFSMRDGEITGHLRHGQDRKPQAVTRAGSDEWGSTLMDHEFDVAYAGHHHISGRIPWNGPPVFFTGSPKPAGEFVERLGRRGSARGHQHMATVHGVSDDGVTGVFPIDSRGFDPES